MFVKGSWRIGDEDAGGNESIGMQSEEDGGATADASVFEGR